MKIAVIGTGFVGVVTAAVYASFGFEVVGLDVDQKKVELLKKSVVPFYEPGLTELLSAQQQGGSLRFTTEYQEAITDSDVIVIAVGTPSKPTGEADLKYVFAACESLAPYLKEEAIVVVKSTVPPGTLKDVSKKISEFTQTPFFTASVPEFLKEGTAVQDTLHPDRIVIGATEQKVFETLETLHASLSAPIVRVSPESAQLSKYAANAYLATRISFINHIANLCESAGADVQDVIQAMGYDKRIGHHYWYPGFGYGGSCFPKDVKELAAYTQKIGLPHNFFAFLDEYNEKRIPELLAQYGAIIGGWSNKTVAVLGLSFKPNTDDMRVAPSLQVVPFLADAGASIVGYDPKALDVAKTFFESVPNMTFSDSVAVAVAGADVIIALIEWKEIISFDFAGTAPQKPTWFIDARNQFDPAELRNAGYTYLGVGRV